jgi:hypothetical protein
VTAGALIKDLRGRGITLRPVGDRLRVEAPRGVLTAQERELLAAQKSELLILLTTAASSSPTGIRGWMYPWPDALPGLGQLRVDAFEMCAGCVRVTWVFYGSTPLCFRCASRLAQGAR